MDPLTVLDAIEIPSPCPADWAEMPGDDRTRFCRGCRKHVHNLSALTAGEAARLLQGPELPCVRLERRGDGGVVTARRRPLRLARLAAGALVGLTALGGCSPTAATGLGGWVRDVLGWFRSPAGPPPPASPPLPALMGTPAPPTAVVPTATGVNSGASPSTPKHTLGKPSRKAAQP